MPESIWMSRRFLWFLALIGCACKSAPSPNVLTETVAGGWHRANLRTASAFDAPDPVPRNSIQRLEIANYEGPGKLEARLYVLTSSAIGLDMVQRWHPS